MAELDFASDWDELCHASRQMPDLYYIFDGETLPNATYTGTRDAYGSPHVLVDSERELRGGDLGFDWGIETSQSLNLAIILLSDFLPYDIVNDLKGIFLTTVLAGLPDTGWRLTRKEIVEMFSYLISP